MSDTLSTITPTLSNKVYDKLKFVALILLPASGTLYFTLGGVWNWSHVTEVIGTITAVDTFLGVLLGINSKVYQEAEPAIDGTIVVQDTGDGLMLAMQPNKNPGVMVEQQYLTFKTVKKSPSTNTSFPEETL